MPVSHDHLRDTVQTWNGKEFKIMALKDAVAAQEAGKVQIATNLSASDLKRPDEFKKTRRKKKTDIPGLKYETREMKAKT